MAGTAGRDTARRGAAGQGAVRQVRYGASGRGRARFGEVRCGRVWRDMAGDPWFGSDWLGRVWSGAAGDSRRGELWSGGVWDGNAGEARRGAAQIERVEHGKMPVWRGEERHGVTRSGMATQAGRGGAGNGTARRC